MNNTEVTHALDRIEAAFARAGVACSNVIVGDYTATVILCAPLSQWFAGKLRAEGLQIESHGMSDGEEKVRIALPMETL